MKHIYRIITILTVLALSMGQGLCATQHRPVTPKASKEARALLSYIYSIQGDKVLSGQQGAAEVEYAKGVTGRYPAIMGLDFIHEERNEQVIQQAKDWWQRGGIPTIMWHWGAPGIGQGYENSKKEIDIDRCFQKGTVEYEAFWSDLKRIADHLTVLRDAGIPIIWVLCHCGDPRADFDPGAKYYDIVGADAYQPDRVRIGMYKKK